MSPDDTNDTPAASEEAGAQGPQGVFGNLPQTRPGARSPRRDAASRRKRDAGATKAEATTTTRRAAATKPAPATTPLPPEDREPAPAGRAGEESPSGGGIEDVAWAGVAAAAEAATIGVRLATRALEAMRDAVDRR